MTHTFLHSLVCWRNGLGGHKPEGATRKFPDLLRATFELLRFLYHLLRALQLVELVAGLQKIRQEKTLLVRINLRFSLIQWESDRLGRRAHRKGALVFKLLRRGFPLVLDLPKINVPETLAILERQKESLETLCHLILLLNLFLNPLVLLERDFVQLLQEIRLVNQFDLLHEILQLDAPDGPLLRGARVRVLFRDFLEALVLPEKLTLAEHGQVILTATLLAFRQKFSVEVFQLIDSLALVRLVVDLFRESELTAQNYVELVVLVALAVNLLPERVVEFFQGVQDHVQGAPRELLESENRLQEVQLDFDLFLLLLGHNFLEVVLVKNGHEAFFQAYDRGHSGCVVYQR